MNRVTVYVRSRPSDGLKRRLSNESLEEGDGSGSGTAVGCGVDSDTGEVFLRPNIHGGERRYRFDGVFDGARDTQAAVYRISSSHLVPQVLGGISSCFICYGPTGAGKTYTCFGPPNDARNTTNLGLFPRAVHSLFEAIDARGQHCSVDAGDYSGYRVAFSYFQIYVDKVQDLLSFQENMSLPVRERSAGSCKPTEPRVYIEGLTERPCGSADDVLAAFEEGDRNKTVAQTCLNRHSSRAHTLLSLVVIAPGGKSRSTLTLVDLAGSERAGRMRLSGKLLDEAKAINRNLNALGNVVSSLSGEGVSQKFVPWRDSKLTRILSEPMSNGKCHTVLMVNISPDLTPEFDEYEAEDGHETQTALEFGERAMCAKTSNLKELQTDDLRKVCDALHQELDQQRDATRAMRIQHVQTVRHLEEDVVVERNRVANLLDFLHEKGFDTSSMDLDNVLSADIQPKLVSRPNSSRPDSSRYTDSARSLTLDFKKEGIAREGTDTTTVPITTENVVDEDLVEEDAYARHDIGTSMPRQSPETIRLVESFQQHQFAVSSVEETLRMLVSMVRVRDSWILSLAAHVTQLHRLLSPDNDRVPPRLYGMFLDAAGVWSGERWNAFFREAGLPPLGRDHEFILREISACTAPAEEWARALRDAAKTFDTPASEDSPATTSKVPKSLADVRRNSNEKLRKIAPELEALVRKCAEVSRSPARNI